MSSEFSFEDKNTRIMIADDMSLSRVTAKKLLEALGFADVEVAENGKKAWEALEKANSEGKPFRLVLTDWMMPELNGVELLDKIKESKWSIIPPVILLTAETDATQVAQAIKKGISGYLVKPFTTDALKQVLVSVAQRSKSNTSGKTE